MDPPVRGRRADRRRLSAARDSAPPTLLSVVVPTFDRADLLRRCLEALARQTQAAATFEVVVVVDGSRDETLETLRRFEPPWRLRILEREHSGPAAARNAGADAATGRYCLFVDDDVLAEEGLVAAHLRAQQETGGVAAIGRLEAVVPRRANPFTRHLEQTRIRHYDRLADSRRRADHRDAYGGNLSVPRDVFLDVGGFARDLPRAHDVELAYRLHELGLPFVFVGDALGREVWPGTFSFAASHYERAGRAAVELYRRHPPLLDQLELGLPWEPSPPALVLFRLLVWRRTPLFLARLAGRVVGPRARDRWFRLLARVCYWRGVAAAVPDRETWRRLLYGTPILMYHAIGAANEAASRYIVPIGKFAKQMRWLHRRGYRVLSLGDYARLRRERRLVQDRTIVLTFDDGYADNAELAAPVLSALGFSGTIFVVSDRIGGTNDWTDAAEEGGAVAGRPLASAAQLGVLRAAGLEIGAHTRTHPRLPQLGDTAAEAEISGSRHALEDRLAAPVTTFAYPYGELDDEVAAQVEAAGYTAACTVRPGLNRARTPLYRLRRAEIRGTESIARFALAVRLGDPEALVARRRG